MDHMSNDNFRNRGAVEQESPEQEGNLNFRGQIGHRHKGPLIDGHDTDFPEPGENPEHTGEVIMATENSGKSEPDRKPPESKPDDSEQVDQDPGMRQKQNQNEEKDDPLAA